LIVDGEPDIAAAPDFLLRRNSETALLARSGGERVDMERSLGSGASVTRPYSIEHLVRTIDALPGSVAQPGGT
jgi:hypothetical protein